MRIHQRIKTEICTICNPYKSNISPNENFLCDFITENYDDKSNVVMFETTSKDGKKFSHKVNKDVIREIQDVGDIEK